MGTGSPKASDLTYFLRWTCTALNTSSRFSTTKSPSRMRWSPGCGGCGPGSSPEPSMDLSRSPDSAASLRPPAPRPSCSAIAAASLATTSQVDAEPSDRHRPHVLRAASAFRSEPPDGFRQPQGFRLAELLHWLHSVPPLSSRRSLDGSCVTDAPKKNLEADEFRLSS